MKNFIQPGDIVTVQAPANVASGDGVLVGTLFGVAAVSALSTKPVEIKTNGVFVLPKTSAQAWTVGATLYWDNTNKCCTTADGSGANVKIGKALAVANNPSATGTVLLDG